MSTQLVIYGVALIVCGTVIQLIQPGNHLASMLIVGGLGVGGVGHARKHREASKAKKNVVDLEATASALRTELFEATRHR